MATRTITRIYPTTDDIHRGSVRILGATGLTNATTDVTDVIGPDAYSGYTERTVQVVGTFGTGGTLLIEGSIDGTNYSTLNDPQGNALSVQVAKIETIMEATPYLRARVSAGDGTTDLAVYFFLRQNRL